MKKPDKRDNEITYWESMADGVIGLLLCVLLILMLLILYLMKATDNLGDNDEDNFEAGGYGITHPYDYEHADEEEGEDEEDEEEDVTHGGGGGGFPYEDPDPGMGEGDGSDKAAVLVQVVDGETLRTIKKKGIQFELYNSASALQVLSTYYPVKTDYKKYETDKDGVFYLPEKIRLGTYYLHDLTPIDGYDLVGNWEFVPDRDYDWDEPFLVSVEVFPSKNIVRLQLNDADDGTALSGASFEIVAAENITTKDGTTRYKQGEIADTVDVDENGYGESKELYLGKYLIRQKTVPEYYSCILSDKSVEVKSKSEAAVPALNELREQKTTLQVKVTDALYENQPIANAVFEITTGNGDRVGNLTTDSNGEAVLRDLQKGLTYKIKQTASAKNYKIDPAEYAYTVNEKGLINGKEAESVTIQNSIVRAAFSVRDKLFGSQLSDINVTLMDDNGKVIQSWNTSAVENIIEGLVPGEYRVVLSGDESRAYSIVVNDVVELQEFSFTKWTPLDIGSIVLAIIWAAGVAAILIWIFRRRSRKNLSEE